jgi:hypothetical protein
MPSNKDGVEGNASLDHSCESDLRLDRWNAAGCAHLVPLERAGVRDGNSTKSAKTQGIDQESQSRTHDRQHLPPKVLLVRGTARMEPVHGIVPGYAIAAERYFGSQQGKVWVSQLASMIQIWFASLSRLNGLDRSISKRAFPALFRCEHQHSVVSQ